MLMALGMFSVAVLGVPGMMFVTADILEEMKSKAYTETVELIWHT